MYACNHTNSNTFTFHTQLDLDPEMLEALDSLNVHGYAAYAMARDLVAQKQQQAQVGGMYSAGGHRAQIIILGRLRHGRN
jgi:uncharacterized protein (UPF0261 family)